MASTLAPGTLLHGKTYRITRFLSRGGKEIAPCVYDFADYFERGFALVRKANREFFIDRDGKEVSFS